MRSKGAYTSIEHMISASGTAIPRVWPVVPDVEFLSSQVDTARHRSLIMPRDQQNISASDATVSNRSGRMLTGVAIGGFLAIWFAIFLLLLVPCYLKRRRRRAAWTRTDDTEHSHSWRTKFVSGNRKALTRSHLDCFPRNNSNPVTVSQHVPINVAKVGLRTSPSSKVKVTGEEIRKPSRPARPPRLLIPVGRVNLEELQGDSSEAALSVNLPASPSGATSGRIGKPSLPRRPPPLVLHSERIVREAPKIGFNTGIGKLPRTAPLRIPTGRATREMLQGDSSKTAATVNHPALPSSKATGGRIGNPSPPMRTPPLVLHRERVVRKAPKTDSNTVAKSRAIIAVADEGRRGSLRSMLPNPWNSDARPQHATFEPPISRPPYITARVRRANALIAGLPCNPEI